MLNQFQKWSSQYTQLFPSLYYSEAEQNSSDLLESRKKELKELLTKVDFSVWPFSEAKDYFEKVATHDKTLSRYCLAKCLENLKKETKESSEIHISLSHTKNIAAFCAVSAHSSSVLNLGVDLELKDRVITEEVAERIKRSAQSKIAQSMDPLKLWLAKEAAFKAVNRISKKSAMPITNVMQLDVESFNAETGEGIMMAKDSTFKNPFKIVESEKALLCLAYSINA